MTTLVLTTRAPEETEALGAAMGARLRPGDTVALRGELGAGKTCFVRGVARGMGLDPSRVSSPTFVLAQEYGPANGEGPSLVHIDAYRLAGADDLDAAGWDSLTDGSSVVVIEWPERIEQRLPSDRIEVEFEHGPAHAERRLTLTARGALAARIEGLGSAQ